jgi:hypothetical protein
VPPKRVRRAVRCRTAKGSEPSELEQSQTGCADNLQRQSRLHQSRSPHHYSPRSSQQLQTRPPQPRNRRHLKRQSRTLLRVDRIAVTTAPTDSAQRNLFQRNQHRRAPTALGSSAFAKPAAHAPRGPRRTCSSRGCSWCAGRAEAEASGARRGCRAERRRRRSRRRRGAEAPEAPARAAPCRQAHKTDTAATVSAAGSQRVCNSVFHSTTSTAPKLKLMIDGALRTN